MVLGGGVGGGVYMITRVETSDVNVNRINKIKGVAMEKLIDYTLRTFYTNVEKPKEIKKIVENIFSNLKNKFIVSKTLYIDGKVYSAGSVIDIEEIKNAKNIVVETKDSKTLVDNSDIDKALNELFQNKVLERLFNTSGSKRLNNWRIIDTGKEKKLIIYEVANREFSKLQRKDAIRLFECIAELMKYLNVKKANIIINERKENLENKNSERISKHVFHILRKIREKYGLSIRIVALDEWLKNYWLRNRKNAIYEVYVWRDEKGKYKYGILEASSPSGIPPVLILRYLGDKKLNNINIKII